MTQLLTHPDGSRPSRSCWEEIALFLITVAVLLLCGMILHPFLAAITGAVVLAVVTQSPYRWLEQRLAQPTLAAAISITLVTLCIIGPVAYLAQGLGHHLLLAAHAMQRSSAQHSVEAYIQNSPRLSRAASYLANNFDLNGALSKSAGVVGGWLASFFGSSIQAVYQTVILLFLLFFLYRDHALALSSLRKLVPLNAADTQYLLTRVGNTIRATVLGRFVVAAAQGFVAGITYALLGVPAASLFGIATALFALIPAFGAVLIWAPIALWLVIAHHWIQAIILAIVGSLVISLLDNFLYPILVGNQVQLHTTVIFFSLLGGVWLFGISGLVLGPILFTIAGSLLYLWRHKTDPDTQPQPASQH